MSIHSLPNLPSAPSICQTFEVSVIAEKGLYIRTADMRQVANEPCIFRAEINHKLGRLVMVNRRLYLYNTGTGRPTLY